MTNKLLSQDQVIKFIQNRIAEDLEMPLSDIDVDTDLTDLGLSSVLIAFLEGELEDTLDIEIPPAMLFKMHSIRHAAQELIKLQQNDIAAAAQ